jgi:hypothetical protein
MGCTGKREPSLASEQRMRRSDVYSLDSKCRVGVYVCRNVVQVLVYVEMHAPEVMCTILVNRLCTIQLHLECGFKKCYAICASCADSKLWKRCWHNLQRGICVGANVNGCLTRPHQALQPSNLHFATCMANVRCRESQRWTLQGGGSVAWPVPWLNVVAKGQREHEMLRRTQKRERRCNALRRGICSSAKPKSFLMGARARCRHLCKYGKPLTALHKV